MLSRLGARFGRARFGSFKSKQQQLRLAILHHADARLMQVGALSLVIIALMFWHAQDLSNPSLVADQEPRPIPTSEHKAQTTSEQAEASTQKLIKLNPA